MKLAELLLQRAQLQKDLAEKTELISDNIQVLEGEKPVEDVDKVFQGQTHCCACVPLSSVFRT